MEGPRVLLLLIILFLFFSSPDTRPPSLSQQFELDHVIAEEINSLAVLNGSSYGDFDPPVGRWLNLTGFRQNDNYAWDLLPHVKAKAKDQRQRVFSANPKTSQDQDNNETEVTKNGSDIGVGHESPPTEGGENIQKVYQNVTGWIRGKWVRSEPVVGHRPPILNMSSFALLPRSRKESFLHNVTGRGGDLSFNLDEKQSQQVLSSNGYAREIKAEMTLKDEGSNGDGWTIVLHGVHYPQRGNIVLTSTSSKFSGMFALPQLAVWEGDFIPARDLLLKTLPKTIARQKHLEGSVNPWTTSLDGSFEPLVQMPQCDYIVYLQQKFLELPHHEEPSRIEDELRIPSGASLPPVPPMTMSAVIFSPDCGFVLESKGPPDFAPQHGNHLNGPKLEVYLRQARYTILACSLALWAEVFILLRQMRDASTPSTRSRISFYTIAILAMGDGFIWLVVMTTAIFVDALYITCLSTVFPALLCASFFGMKFLMDIWSIQAPERTVAGRQNTTDQANSRAGVTPQNSSADSPGLPLPATARRPTDTGATPVILPPDQDLGAAEAEDVTQPVAQTTLGSARREMGAVYVRFYLLLVTILLLSAYALTWPSAIRSLYANAVSFVYLSFWVPQIYRNIIRNSRRALRFEFVIGQSCLRLAPFLYLYAVPENIFYVDVNPTAAYVLTAWLWIQVWALISQEILGPRFFVRSAWAPPAYDYHPVLREDDEESGAGMPIGFTQATAGPSSPTAKPGENLERGKKVFDCAICMQNLEVSVIPAGGDQKEGNTAAAASIFARRNYMVTPCRHIFHSACLEGWLRYRRGEKCEPMWRCCGHKAQPADISKLSPALRRMWGPRVPIKAVLPSLPQPFTSFPFNPHHRATIDEKALPTLRAPSVSQKPPSKDLSNMSNPYNQYPPNYAQGGYPPQEGHPPQGYGQQGYPPPQPQYGDAPAGYGPPHRADSFGPPQNGGFQHGQHGGQYGAYDTSNPQGHGGYYGSPPPQDPRYQDPYAQQQQQQQQQGGYPQHEPSYQGSDPNYSQQHQQQQGYQDPNAPYDPNAPEGDRGLGGAIAGGLAGRMAGNKYGNHGFMGMIGGAIAGSKLEDKFKDKKNHGGGHHGGGGSSWGGGRW